MMVRQKDRNMLHFIPAVKGCCIRWQYNNNTNFHLLDITMKSKEFHQDFCVDSLIDHDSCVCLIRLSMLIDPQNMKAAVHIA